MVYSKMSKQFVTKGLKAKREREFYVKQTLEFDLPGKMQFYQVFSCPQSC